MKASLVTTLVLAAACTTEPFDTPSAYESQRALCTPEHASAWAEAIAACRADHERDGSCGGVVSFAGVLQGQPVVVEAALSEAEVIDVERLDASFTRERVSARGRSPYFDFLLVYKSVGGPIASGDGAGALRSLSVDVGAKAADDEWDDSLVTSSLRLTNGGASVDLSAIGGSLDVTMQTETEQRGTFVSEMPDPGDHIEGCFELLITQRFVEQEGA